MKKVAAFLGSGLRSFVKMNPRSVAPPTTMAKGKLRANHQLRPWGTKYAVQYQARIPSHGLRRHTGTSPRATATKRVSLTAGACRGGYRACSPLFHRHALGKVPRLIDVAAPRHGDVIREQLEGDDRHEGRQEL